MKKYQVLARKYRPQRFREVVGQETIVTTLKNALRFSKVAHAYLFCGSRGTGKTTLARLFAKALNCQALDAQFEPCNTCFSCTEIMSGQSLDVIEIDGASNRGIDDIRQINETIGYAPSQGRYKIYIIDEVHMLTKEAFNALLKTLEEPPEKAKFFFATTEAHKILPTVISRCQRFDLGRILPSQIVTKLDQIVQDLSRSIDPEALHKIADLSEGSLRDAESLLDQILCFLEGHVSIHAVREVFGLVSEESLFSLDIAFSESNLSYAFELVEYLYKTGKDFSHFMQQLIEHYRLLSLYKSLGESALPSQIASKYAPSSRLYTQSQCLYLLEYLLNAETNLQKSLSSRIFLESVLLHVIKTKNKVPVEVLVRRLMELEHSIATKTPMPSLPPQMKAVLKETTEQTHPSKKEISPIEKNTSEASLAKQGKEELQPLKNVSISAPTTLSKPSLEQNEVPWESAKHPEIEIALQPSKLPPPSVEIPRPEELSQQQATLSLGKIVTEGKTKIEIPVALPEPKNIIAQPSTKKENDLSIAKKISKETKHPSHYDTLMRFAAVELEGSLKL